MFRRFTSERVRQRRRRRFVVLTVVYALLALSLLLFVWQLSYARFLQINTVAIVGEKTIAHADISAVARTALEGAYGHLFSKRNMLLYPRTYIEKTLQNKFPSIKDVSLDIEGGHILRIRIDERDAVAIACRLKSDLPTDGREECYFVDATALLFIKAPRFSGSSYVTYELSMTDAPLGTYALAPEEFTQLHTFITSLGQVSMRAVRVRVDKDTVEITATTNGHGTIRLLVKRGSPYGEAINTLSTVIASDDFKKATELERVDYIDLRFGNKIFYKEKEVADQTMPEHTVSPELKPLE